MRHCSICGGLVWFDQGWLRPICGRCQQRQLALAKWGAVTGGILLAMAALYRLAA